MKIKALLLATVTLIAPISAASASYTPPLTTPKANAILFNDCGTNSFKPSSITQFCADAGVSLARIHWSTWQASGATGTALLSINSCTPNCAAGTFYTTRVNVALSKLISYHHKIYLTQVTVSTPAGTSINLPPSMTSVPGGLTWISAPQTN